MTVGNGAGGYRRQEGRPRHGGAWAGDSLVPLGGQLIGGPSAAWVPPGQMFPAGAVAVFGRGTDNQLWWKYQTASGWSPWASLGGRLTSAPAAAAMPTYGGSSGEVLVYVRGADGALWERTMHPHGTPRWIWEGWQGPYGRLLPGTGPAVAAGPFFFVAVTGTDRAVWLLPLLGGQPTWRSLGGQTTSTPGIALPYQDERIVAFARGLDHAAWYDQYDPVRPGAASGWHSLGGGLTSGVTALTTAQADQGPQKGATYLFALGPGNQALMRAGTWPALGGWTRP